MPEAPAILNTYEFLKNAVFRLMTRTFAGRREVLDLIGLYKRVDGVSGHVPDLITETKEVFPDAAAAMSSLCGKFCPAIVFNRCTGDDRAVGNSLNMLSRKYLSITTRYLGSIPEDPVARMAAGKAQPYVLLCPDAICSRKIREMQFV